MFDKYRIFGKDNADMDWYWGYVAVFIFMLFFVTGVLWFSPVYPITFFRSI